VDSASLAVGNNGGAGDAKAFQQDWSRIAFRAFRVIALIALGVFRWTIVAIRVGCLVVVSRLAFRALSQDAVCAVSVLVLASQAFTVLQVVSSCTQGALSGLGRDRASKTIVEPKRYFTERHTLVSLLVWLELSSALTTNLAKQLWGCTSTAPLDWTLVTRFPCFSYLVAFLALEAIVGTLHTAVQTAVNGRQTLVTFQVQLESLLAKYA
jgi:hypothetical protein